MRRDDRTARRLWWLELVITWLLFAYCVYLGAGGDAFPH